MYLLFFLTLRQVSEPENVSENPDLDSNTASPNLHGVEKKEKFEFYPRVLFFTRERILILVASDMSSNEYMVKSNRHLTELSKVNYFHTKNCTCNTLNLLVNL